MKLRFLGQAYNTFDNSVETIPSKHIACFRGRRYTIHRPVKTINSPLGVRKKYRGVAYGA